MGHETGQNIADDPSAHGPPDDLRGGPLRGMRLVLAEPDPGRAAERTDQLRRAGAAEVAAAADLDELLAALRAGPVTALDWDVLVWDDAMHRAGPDRDELLARWTRTQPGIPLVILTGEVTVERAVAALRGHAADVLPRDTGADDLVGSVARAYERRLRSARPPGSRELRMLVVGAHPDDAEIGAGGTIHRRRSEGWRVTVLTLSHGGHGGDPDRRVAEAHRAAEVLGAGLVLEDLPDGRIADTVATVQVIEKTVREVNPHVLLVHSPHDTHQDHRAVHRATMVAARRVDRVACYQSPSATVDYRPNRFVTLGEDDLSAKLSAIRAHRSQSAGRGYLDDGLLRSTARYWSRFTRDTYAEPQELLRDTTAGIEPTHL